MHIFTQRHYLASNLKIGNTMKPRSYMALVLITIAVACSANARNELAKYIIKDDIRQFRTTIAALAKGEQLDLASHVMSITIHSYT